ncbi:MAG: phytanoyl-CoA dioxygenase family protein [Burkholderiaceae bacterium]
MPSVLTPEQRAAFDRDGFVLVRGFFDEDEAHLLQTAIDLDPAIRGHFYDRGDAQGMTTKMATWNHPGESVYGYAARSHKMVDTMEDLLGGEVYHYHSKITAKEPREGGAWEWHQDYGYWYQNGCLYPDMASCLIAISPANQANGCLQVIPESHKMGRIDHVTVGDQFQTDPDRVNAALERLPLIYCELQPGDAIFFHSNLLHRSDANTSDDPRLSIICCYNTKRNDPIKKDGRHPNYSPLEIWSDEKVSQTLKSGNL